MRLAFTADLHWGHRRGGDAVRLLASFLHQRPPDVLVLAGDLGVGPLFDECLGLFADLPCRKAVVPGNHDVWVAPEPAEGDSLQVYEQRLPATCARLGFHYLDHGPLLLPDAGLALVGSINWYDYTWALDAIRRRFPEEEHRLLSKRFTRGRHNDAQFVRWPLTDAAFTARVVAALGRHLQAARARADKVIVTTHHPPFHGLGFPEVESPPSVDALLWQAFSGNSSMEELLKENADHIPFAFCGHTHLARENRLGPIRGFNIGGDYERKRLLWLEWPAGTMEAHEFGPSQGGDAAAGN